MASGFFQIFSEPSIEDVWPQETVGQGAEGEKGKNSTKVDLTILSSTMVYSEVLNMMTVPEQYVGRTVKMRGGYSYAEDASTGKHYDLCVIQDATACCASGMEFILADESLSTADYPEVGEIITVEGTFDTYMEGEYMYCTLREARFL